MPATQTVVQIQEELETMLDFSGDYAEKPYILDFAKIASYLTDKEACINLLSRLNAELIKIAEVNEMRRTGACFGGYKRKLVKEKVSYAGEKLGSFYKTGGILKGYLDAWEATYEFNREHHTADGGLPSGTPLLTGFVQPPDFRKYLLKHGYHWTDIGVAERHGEFTHRLHWYIVTKKLESTPGWLQNRPIDLFRQCGEDWSVKSGSKTIWDRVFDNIKKQTNGMDNVFRNPETLHAFLITDTTCKRKDLWALAQIIRSRCNRVKAINKLKDGVPFGIKRLDHDMAARQTLHQDQIIAQGDISAKIVWQKIQEGEEGQLMNDFLEI